MKTQLPKSFEDIISGINSLNSNITAKLSELAGGLATVPAAYISHELAGTCSTSAALRHAFDLLMQKSGKLVCIHPWTYGVGEIEKSYYSEQNYAYLSPANALNALSAKLMDQNDPAKDDAVELLYIVITSLDIFSFAVKVELFSKIFAIDELEMCARRARQLCELETKKYTEKQPFNNPHWKDFDITTEKTAAELQVLTEKLITIGEAYTGDISPVAELNTVIAEKITEISRTDAELAALIATMQYVDDSIAVYTKGTCYSLGTALKTTTIESGNTFTLLLAMVANTTADDQPGDIRFFKEVFIPDDPSK